MTEEEYYANIRAEYEASTDAKLVEWARPYFEGTKKPNSKDRYVICPVSDRAAQDIFELTGSDVRGFEHTIDSDVLRHINNRHGKHGKADSSMRDIFDLGRIAYVLNNYDYIDTDIKIIFGVLDKNGKPSKSLKFVKRINGYVMTAEAITDSPKKKALYIRSVYKAKTIQKESRMVDSDSPRPDVRNAYGSSTSILPQSEKNVNSLEEKSFDPPDHQAKRRLTADDGRAKIAAEMAEIKAELRGKSPSEIAEMSRQARQKNKQNSSNANGNGGKPSSGNGSGGNSGR